MKKFGKILLAVVLASFIATGTGLATQFTYNDDFANWPGHFVTSADEIGWPIIPFLNSMVVTTYDNDYLKSVAIKMTGRRVFDSLFINTDGAGANYEAWDYYVKDDTLVDGGATFHTVSQVSYTYSLAPEGRTGHPNGFLTGISDPIDGYIGPLGVSWVLTYDDPTNDLNDVGILTYNFVDGKINVGEDGSFVIGYAPWCANDVFLTPLPEPTSLLLLGLGLIGLAGIRRIKG